MILQKQDSKVDYIKILNKVFRKMIEIYIKLVIVFIKNVKLW